LGVYFANTGIRGLEVCPRRCPSAGQLKHPQPWVICPETICLKEVLKVLITLRCQGTPVRAHLQWPQYIIINVNFKPNQILSMLAFVLAGAYMQSALHAFDDSRSSSAGRAALWALARPRACLQCSAYACNATHCNATHCNATQRYAQPMLGPERGLACNAMLLRLSLSRPLACLHTRNPEPLSRGGVRPCPR